MKTIILIWNTLIHSIKLWIASKWGHNSKHSVPRIVPKGFVIGERIEVTPGRRHAWFNSTFGKIRKPI